MQVWRNLCASRKILPWSCEKTATRSLSGMFSRSDVESVSATFALGFVSWILVSDKGGFEESTNFGHSSGSCFSLSKLKLDGEERSGKERLPSRRRSKVDRCSNF